MYGTVDDFISSLLKVPNTCFPTSLAAIIACLTAPESPENVSITSFEQLVPPFPGVEYPTISTLAAFTAVSASNTPIPAGAPTVIPKDFPILDDQYEKKLSSYRRRYKKPIKAFFGKHPIIREIIVGVLIELIVMTITGMAQNDRESCVKEESLQIEYHSENKTYNMQIGKDAIDEGIAITFPDDSTLILNMP